VRKMVTEGVKKQLDTLYKRFPNDATVLMGDFNEKRIMLDKTIATWSHGMVRVAPEGEPPTYRRGRSRDIDHLVMDREHADMSKQIRVLDHWGLSDHYPIINILDGRKYTTPSVEVKERMKISRGDKEQTKRRRV